MVYVIQTNKQTNKQTNEKHTNQTKNMGHKMYLFWLIIFTGLAKKICQKCKNINIIIPN